MIFMRLQRFGPTGARGNGIADWREAKGAYAVVSCGSRNNTATFASKACATTLLCGGGCSRLRDGAICLRPCWLLAPVAVEEREPGPLR